MSGCPSRFIIGIISASWASRLARGFARFHAHLKRVGVPHHHEVGQIFVGELFGDRRRARRPLSKPGIVGQGPAQSNIRMP